MRPWLAILPVLPSTKKQTTNAAAKTENAWLGFSDGLFASISTIAPSNPATEQISPPREPVCSSAAKHTSAAPDRKISLTARLSLDRDSNIVRTDSKLTDCAAENAEQNQRIPPAPSKVAAVL